MKKEIKEKIIKILMGAMTEELAKDYAKGLLELFFQEKQELIEDIKNLQIKVSSPDSEYINKLPQIQILDEVLEIIEREIKKS